MKEQKERHEKAMFVISGYDMQIYCQFCLKHAEYTDDGIDCYSLCRRRARRNGWVLHKDGFATCGDCAK